MRSVPTKRSRSMLRPRRVGETFWLDLGEASGVAVLSCRRCKSIGGFEISKSMRSNQSDTNKNTPHATLLSADFCSADGLSSTTILSAAPRTSFFVFIIMDRIRDLRPFQRVSRVGQYQSSNGESFPMLLSKRRTGQYVRLVCAVYSIERLLTRMLT